ncbi:hypothetical protein D3C77_421510 [compost metagenome]
MQQGVVVAADQDQIRTAIDFFAGMVVGQLLGAVVTAENAGHQRLADTEGLHIGQVLFQRQAPQRQFLFVQVTQRLLDFLHRPHHGLPPPCGRTYRFDSYRTVTQQKGRGTASVLHAKHRVAAKQSITGLTGKVISPAKGVAGVGRQGVGYRLGGHIGPADNTAEQVLG